MTAKEYCQFVEWDATEELISMLQDFATIKCKEQRELCWEDMKGFDYEVPEDRNVAKNIILNAKQPEV